MKKISLKKIGLLLEMAAIVLLFFYIPIVPQYKLMEVLTEEGGYVEKYYTVTSLHEIQADYPCSLHCFPSTDETLRFNVAAMAITVLILCLLLGLLIRKWVKMKR